MAGNEQTEKEEDDHINQNEEKEQAPVRQKTPERERTTKRGGLVGGVQSCLVVMMVTREKDGKSPS